MSWPGGRQTHADTVANAGSEPWVFFRRPTCPPCWYWEFATGSGFGEVKIWDLSTERVLDLRGHTDLVEGLACSPDGRRLATGSDDRTIKLWDTTTGEEVFTLRGHTAGVTLRGVQPRRPAHRLGGLGPDGQGLGHESSGVRCHAPARG